MKTIQVELAEKRYPIHIGSGLFEKLPQFLEGIGWGRERRLMLVADSHVSPLYAERVLKPLEQAGFTVGQITHPAGEESKSLHTLERLVEDCIRFGLDRSGAVLALGGGVTGDLAGFLAASYMRGIPFIQLPTTLLAHDSSVGGKVGVNHPLGKNMIGAFHQPAMVVFDTDVLKTLPEREILSGCAEVVKHALIWDASFADWLMEHHRQLMALEPEVTAEAIERGCRVKAAVVSQDEKESGIRAILNYGHTIGHALESVSGYGAFTHGEAVAVGMAGAALLGEALGTATEVFPFTRELLAAFRLPTHLSPVWAEEELLAAMKRDKKAKKGAYTFVLPTGIGSVVLQHGVEEAAIREVLARLRGGESR
ncbi:3-dehydroquinate synthase [Salinithrix halophila]|uniref:3-dehydroquinate synthase n=1 Tax=Salinithrix halophila TaxID=1485204 RepID=A0ABV8JLM0_9BACL